MGFLLGADESSPEHRPSLQPKGLGRILYLDGYPAYDFTGYQIFGQIYDFKKESESRSRIS